MHPTIAIIGWGSLLWDLENLATHVTGGWQIDQGPVLPVEFVRISAKRQHGLVLVIEREHGIACCSSVIASNKVQVKQAVVDLAQRERAPIESIGFVDLLSGEQGGQDAEVVAIILSWVKKSGFQAAVWTDLAGNFTAHTGMPFSVPRAIEYLKTLSGDSLLEAKRYIDNAPRSIETPLRQAINNDPWWREITEI